MVLDKHGKRTTCPRISEKRLSLKLGNVYWGPLLILPIEGQLNKSCSSFIWAFDSLTYSKKDFLRYDSLANQYNTVNLLDFPQNKLGHI